MYLVGCAVRWTTEENTNRQDGRSNSADTVDECQSACIVNNNCDAVDWNPAAGPDQKCWLHGDWSGGKNSGGATGITHYILTRDCRGKNLYPARFKVRIRKKIVTVQYRTTTGRF